MTRGLWLYLVFAVFLPAPIPSPAQTATPQQQTPSKQQEPPDETNPPEEDESVAPKKYVLNPLESERNIEVGDMYFKTKKDYRAARGRYLDATRYNPSSAKAFFKLGEAEAKLKNKEAANKAFQKVINLEPNSKLAEEAKKKIGSKG